MEMSRQRGRSRCREAKLAFSEPLAPSLRPMPDAAFTKVPLTPMEELTLMIKLGYGDVPRYLIPVDWRTRPNSGPRR